MKHVTTFLILLVLVIGSRAAPLELRLLLSTDLHMQLLDHDDLSDRPVSHYGLVRTASLIAAARAEQPNSLLFDNGDLLQGAPLGDWLATQQRGRQAHPAYAALHRLRYDAANLGNHDFDYGLPFLRDAIASTPLPVLNANFLDARTGKPAFRPTLLLRRQFRDERGRPQTLRIGVLGLAPPHTLLWNRALLRDRLRAQDMVAAARQWVPRLRRQGADLVVVVAHSGIGSSSEQAGVALAQVPGVDALLLGHSHSEFPGRLLRPLDGVDAERGLLHGVPAVLPGRWGDHLGQIDLRLEKRQGRWQVMQASTKLRPVRDADGRSVDADATLRQWLVEQHAPLRAWLDSPLTTVSAPLHSHFSQLLPSRLVALVQAAQLDWVRPKLADTPWAGLPLLSAAAPMRSYTPLRPDPGTDIPAGPLRLRQLNDLYPYANSIKVLRLNGAELREWLERAAAQFLPIRANDAAVQPLLDARHAGFNFDQIAGVSYEIDPSVPSRYGPDGRLLDPAASRIRELRWQGELVADGQWFLLVTNSFRAAGGGGYPRLPDERMVLDLADESRQAVAAYLRAVPLHELPPAGGWRLRLPPGSQFSLPVSAEALKYLDEVPGLQVLPGEPLQLRWRPDAQR